MLPSNLHEIIGVLNANAEYIYFIHQEKTEHLHTDTNLFQVKIMINKKNQTDFLTKWDETSKKYQDLYIKTFKKLLKKIVKFIPILIGYSFMSWMFIGLYDTIGFEKTLIVLLVGVLWYGIRQNVKIPPTNPPTKWYKMDIIDEMLEVLGNLLKTLISVLIETIKMMLSMTMEVLGSTIKLMLKKNKWNKMETEQTVQEFFKLWFWNFQNPSLNQFSNLYNITIAILKYYDKKNKNNEEKTNYQNEIETILPKLFYNPIETLPEKSPFLKIKSTVNWNIAHLEWCYFRDTKFKTKLSKEYYSDSRKQAEKQMLHLQDVVSILTLFKAEMFGRIIQVLLDENLDIYIPIGTIKEIEQVGRSD